MSSRNNVVIRDGDIKYYFKHLDWDTNFFQRKSFILDIQKSNLKPSQSIKDKIDDRMKGAFITLKIDSETDKKLLDFLQSCGFKYIDTEITLKYEADVDRFDYSNISDIKIIKLSDNKGLPYEALGSVFKRTRFHYDVKIQKKKADRLWINFIKNFRPSPLRHMFVARSSSEVSGAVLSVQSSDRKTLSLSFVSVLEGFRRKKVGSALIQHITGQYCDCKILVGTQARNKAALNFYIRNGFISVYASKIVMHGWF